MIVYVDDCFVVGNKNAVRKALAEIEKLFNITRSKNVEDFIRCQIEREGNKIMLSQPDLIKKLLRQFEEKIESLKKTSIPAPASSHVIRCKENEEGLTDEEQKEYRSGVGSLLYLLKHS